MNAACSSLLSTVRRAWRSLFLAPLGAGLLALAACNGTAVVTMTSTASTDNFLAYRVELVSVQLQTASGNSSLTVLPASTIVDFATLTNMDEVLGRPRFRRAPTPAPSSHWTIAPHKSSMTTAASTACRSLPSTQTARLWVRCKSR